MLVAVNPGRVLISLIKALTFGLIAGLVGCYRGLTVAGGAKGVGTAVNETLVVTGEESIRLECQKKTAIAFFTLQPIG